MQMSYLTLKSFEPRKKLVLIRDDFERPTAEPTFYVHSKIKNKVPQEITASGLISLHFTTDNCLDK